MCVLEMCVKAAEERWGWCRAHDLIIEDMMAHRIERHIHETFRQYEEGMISIIEMCDKIIWIRRHWYYL